MSRKPIAGNEKRSAKINVSVTPTTFANFKLLADITHKGNLNGLVVELIENAIQKNMSMIERIKQVNIDYNAVLDTAIAEYKDFLK